MEIYIILERLLDPMENEIGNAITEKPIGFFLTEHEAIEYCSKGKTYTKTDCWAVMGQMSQYRYLPLPFLITE